MRKTVIVGAIGIVGLGLGLRRCLSESPETTYKVGYFGGDYTLVPIDETNVRLSYATPCGTESIEMPIGDATADDDGVITVMLPEDQVPPSITHVRVDPKLVGKVMLGAITIDNERGTDVLAADCGATLTIDGSEAYVSPSSDTLSDPSTDATLFVTARTEQCFLDQFVAYGNFTPSRPKVLQGANGYWLRASNYDVWFRAIPETAQVTTFRFHDEPQTPGAKLIAALTECDH